jgi:hypothetical protein
VERRTSMEFPTGFFTASVKSSHQLKEGPRSKKTARLQRRRPFRRPAPSEHPRRSGPPAAASARRERQRLFPGSEEVFIGHFKADIMLGVFSVGSILSNGRNNCTLQGTAFAMAGKPIFRQYWCSRFSFRLGHPFRLKRRGGVYPLPLETRTRHRDWAKRPFRNSP